LEKKQECDGKLKDHCLTKIKSLRNEFDAIFNRLEQRAISKMECMKTSFDKKIQADVNRIKDFKEKFQKLNNDFKDGGVTMSSLEMLDEVICDGEEKPLPCPDHKLVVEELYLRDIKQLDDRDKCNISGICKITSGEFILLYNSISKLKLLNSSFSVMSTSDVPKFPWDICRIGHPEAGWPGQGDVQCTQLGITLRITMSTDAPLVQMALAFLSQTSPTTS